MTIIDRLSHYLEKDDITTIRMALVFEIGDMRIDKNELLRAMRHVKNEKPSVFEAHDKKKKFTRPIKNKTDDLQWSADDYNEQLASLKNNFSKERFEHVLDIRESLQNRKEPGFEKPAPEENPHPKGKGQKRESFGQEDKRRRQIILAGILVASAVAIWIVVKSKA